MNVPGPTTPLGSLGEAVRLAFVERQAKWEAENPAAVQRIDALVRWWLDSEPETLPIGERIMRNVMPVNWHPLTPQDRDIALDRMVSSGLCLMWVPRSELVGALIVADTAPERRRILVARSSLLFEDMTDAFAACTAPGLGDYPNVIGEAVTAGAAGYWRAAHALAASVLTGLLDDFFNQRNSRTQRFTWVPRTLSMSPLSDFG